MIKRISVVAGLIVLLYWGVIPETIAAGADTRTDSTKQANAAKGEAEILWDEFGIPHIYGPDLPTVVRGYGYAQMENHAELILQNVALARGRAAEYFGPGANNQNVTSDGGYEFDGQVRPFDVHEFEIKIRQTDSAAAVLEKWDRESDAGSQGAVLFERWYNLYIADSNSPKDDRWGTTYPAFRVEFSPTSALTTPLGLKNPAAAVPFLAQAARELQKQFGRLDIPWGDVYRVVLADHDASYEKPVPLTNVPGAGSPEPFGAMRKAYYYPSPEPNPKFAYDGETYVQVVEFTPKGAVAKALIGYGNASRPGSPHITDQVSYYEQKQLRAVYRTRSEVEAHAVMCECYYCWYFL